MRHSVFGWEVMTELPNVAGFEAVSSKVRREDFAGCIHTGPDPEGHVKVIRKYVERGCDHIALICPGADRAAFIDCFSREMRPALADLTSENATIAGRRGTGRRIRYRILRRRRAPCLNVSTVKLSMQPGSQ